MNSVDLLLLLRLNNWIHRWLSKTLIQSLICVSRITNIASTHKIVSRSSLSNFRSISDQLDIWGYPTIRVKSRLTIIIVTIFIESDWIHHFVLWWHTIHILLILFLPLLLRNSVELNIWIIHDQVLSHPCF